MSKTVIPTVDNDRKLLSYWENYITNSYDGIMWLDVFRQDYNGKIIIDDKGWYYLEFDTDQDAVLFILRYA